jgi:hypothetical protein
MQALKLQHTHLDYWVWFVHFICIIIGCFDLPFSGGLFVHLQMYGRMEQWRFELVSLIVG